MNRLTFQQVESLFETAVGYEPAMRKAFLERVAREHSREIRDLLESLLACDASPTRWTAMGWDAAPSSSSPSRQFAGGETPASGLDAVHSLEHVVGTERAGTVIGRFHLLERLGFGGHGEVYLAEQLAPVKRKVALKMIRSGAASSEVIARFRAEEQALALMNHPGIASVYEAGLAENDRLYFAMEYVQGQPIDVYCDQRKLSVRQRLALLLEACRAVQHAHQKGVIHRDLKPSNMLVTERDGRPMPVLIDFGIAVATASMDAEGGLSANPASGAGGGAIGTPAYMSPEQAGAAPRDIDTRSDIYALGIMLYEQVTGRTPLDVLAPAPRGGASLAEIRRCVMEGSPPLPSELLARRDDAASLAGACRRCSVRRLCRQARGDLDAIIGKAIARDRAERYQTVEALARDLENYLSHRPVTAGSTSAIARSRKFIRRHRVMVSMTMALGAILTIGIIGTTLAMLRATRAAEETSAISSFLQDLLASSKPLEKGASVSFAEVLAGGSAMASERFGSHPRHEGEIRYILGHTYYALAMYREARAELERSVALLRESMGMDDVVTLRSATLLAQALLVLRELDAAEALANEIAEHSANKPGKMREPSLSAQRILADILIRKGRYGEAEARAREFVPVTIAELGPLHLESHNARMALILSLNGRALTQKDAAKAHALRTEVVELLRETIRLQQERFGGDDALPVVSAQLMLAEALNGMRRFDETREIVEPLLPRLEKRFGPTHSMTMEASASMAIVRYTDDDVDGAARLRLKVIEAQTQRFSPRHPAVIANIHDSMVFLSAAGPEFIEEGLRLARQQQEMMSAFFKPDDLLVADARMWVARFCDRAGLLDEAEAIYEDLLPREADLIAESRLTGNALVMFHAGHLARQGRFEEAEARLQALCDRIGGVTVGVDDILNDDIARMFIEIYQAWGREDKVQEYEDVVASIWASTS